MSLSEIDRLLIRYAEGKLSPDEDRQLATALRADPERMSRLLNDVAMTGLLYQLAVRDEDFIRALQERMHAEQSPGAFSKALAHRMTQRSVDSKTCRKPGRRRTIAWVPLAAAASLAVALGVWFLVSRERLSLGAPVASVTETVGSAYAFAPDGARTVLQPGDTLRTGQRLETAADSHLRFVFLDDPTDVLLSDASALSILPASSPARLRLEQGALAVHATREPVDRIFAVDTPHARAEVLGTRFRLFVSETASAPSETAVLPPAAFTRLDVDSGRVRLTRHKDAVAVEVNASEFALASDGIPLQVYSRDTEWIEGRVLFSDNFETTPTNGWRAHLLEMVEGGYAFKESISAFDTPYYSIEPNAGRQPGSSALIVRVPKDQQLGVHMEPLSPGEKFSAIRQEFDVKLDPPAGVIIDALRNNWREVRCFPVDGPGPERLKYGLRKGEWTRMRYDHFWRTDEEGEPCLEIRHYINDRLHTREWHYPNKALFGVMVLSGKVRVDNYVQRELIPARFSAPPSPSPAP